MKRKKSDKHIKHGMKLFPAVIIFLFLASGVFAVDKLNSYLVEKEKNYSEYSQGINEEFKKMYETNTQSPTPSSTPTTKTIKPTPLPTPRPTLKPLPTFKPLPTLKPLPTYTPYPTFKPIETSNYQPIEDTGLSEESMQIKKDLLQAEIDQCKANAMSKKSSTYQTCYIAPPGGWQDNCIDNANTTYANSMNICVYNYKYEMSKLEK